MLVLSLTLGFVGVGVGESGSLTGLAADHAGEVGADLMLATLVDGVALGALLHKDLLSLLNVAHFQS